MENLLCDEVWTFSPEYCCSHDHHYKPCVSENSVYLSKEDYEQDLFINLEKEITYMPQPGYVDYLQSQHLINARFTAIRWLIKSRSRLNLSFGTLFCAINYLDRFISMSQCREWKYWMVQLLSLACLSIASKFNDVSAPSLHEIQMEEQDHSFLPDTIQQMELILLKALGWRVGATTAYSYVELLSSTMDSFTSYLHRDLITRVTDLLLAALLDCKLVEYPPSIVAVSAVWCSLEELIPSASDTHLASITKLFNEEQKDDLARCHLTMKKGIMNSSSHNLIACDQYYQCPSSPVTVLLIEPNINIHNYKHIDLITVFNVSPELRLRNKRKRDQL